MKLCCIILALALGIISCETDLESKSTIPSTINYNKPVDEYKTILYGDNAGNFLLVDSEGNHLTDVQISSTRNPTVYTVAVRNSNARSLRRFSFSDVSGLAQILYNSYTKPGAGSITNDIFFWVADHIYNEVVNSIKNNLFDSSKPTTSSIADNVAKRKKIVGTRRWDMRPW
jgi:hypothetical protein